MLANGDGTPVFCGRSAILADGVDTRGERTIWHHYLLDFGGHWHYSASRYLRSCQNSIMASPLKRNLPNLLTMGRLILSIAFFAALSFYRYPDTNSNLIEIALVLFILAAMTDWLDGMLARKWNVVSMFGRIMDPVCDKVLVIGAFVCLGGPMFLSPVTANLDESPTMISGVYPWMVVVILSRELLVTAIRGLMEAQGVEFGANWSGKAKMVLQSIVIPILLGLIAWADPEKSNWVVPLRTSLIYITLVVTVASGYPYVAQAMRPPSSSTEDDHPN